VRLTIVADPAPQTVSSDTTSLVSQLQHRSGDDELGSQQQSQAHSIPYYNPPEQQQSQADGILYYNPLGQWHSQADSVLYYNSPELWQSQVPSDLSQNLPG
jgi:hypothetical protein